MAGPLPEDPRASCQGSRGSSRERGSSLPLPPSARAPAPHHSAVSGRQLQSEEPDVETEEDTSVTDRPSGEVIRPRPQGSSPVYECVTEGASFGVEDNAPSRRGSSERRRSWWKRGSGDTRTFSSMSHPEPVPEATEMTLKTEVEAGASGYSITGGRERGIFVKQVLKGSSAAKLFSLREGDQLLSATIFFDDIKYEDALKILQYSEPYKVQFQIKRKLCATEDEGWALCSPQHGSEDKEKQDKEIADGCGETPEKTLEGDGDRERLIAKPSEARGRKPRERLSWPKFQGMQGKQGPGPRRSHSSSEAYERGGAREVSPTSTDTEAQFPAEHGEQKTGQEGQRRKRRFLSLRFRMGPRPDPSATGHRNREVLGGLDTTRVLEEKLEDTGVDGRNQERAQVQEARQVLTMKQAMETGFPGQGEGATAKQRRKMKQVEATEKATAHGEAGASLTRVMSKEDAWPELQSLTNGVTTMSLKDTTVTEGTHRQTKEIQVQIRDLKTPKFTFSTEKAPDTANKKRPGLKQRRETMCRAQAGRQGERQVESDGMGKTQPATGGREQGEEKKFRERELQRKQGEEGEEMDKERGELRMKLPRLKLPAFGWSPGKEATIHGGKNTEQKEQQAFLVRVTEMELKGPKEDARGPKGEFSAPELEVSRPSVQVDVQAPGGKPEGEVAAKDSKFKMPKFKMPSFGVSGPGKSMEASLEVSAPKVEADVALPANQGDLKTPEASAQLAFANVDLQAVQVGVKLLEGALPEAELPAWGVGAGLKGHLPRVQMPSIKMPKVDLWGQVELKGPKADARGPKGEVSALELEASPPSVEVDLQAPGDKLEGEVSAKDSKFKMPKFKMPSFGVSAPGKSMEASLEVSAPKVEADVALPATQGDLKTPEASAQLASADVDLQTSQVGVKLLEGALPEAELPATGAGTDLKGHLPRVQMPSIKMPKVDLRGPEVELKGMKADTRGPKGEFSAPELEASPPSVEVDIQVPGGKLEGDVAVKDSKFKMPKFKMPSFGVSATGKSFEASLEVSAPMVEADVALPATQGDLKTPEASAQLASSNVDLQAVQVGVKLPEDALPEAELPASGTGDGLKGHLPRVQLPSMKMPKVDLRGQVELKGPKADARGPKGELSAPELEASAPSMEVDVQVPGGKLEGDVAVKVSKFKMPKFKMPSFGMSAPGKSFEASLELSAPKVEADVALPATQGDLKTPEASAQLASSDVDLQAVQVGVKLPEGALPEAELPASGAGDGLKGHLPRVQLPSMKMPKVDLRGQVELKGPKADARGPKGEVSAPELEASPPSMEVDLQAPGGKLEGEVSAKDNKFKMPKFKMPAFGVSVPGKSMEASLEVSAPKVEADVALPATQGDLKTPEASAQLASADVDLQTGQVGVKLPEGALPEAELPATGAGTDLKGHLPRVQMPKVDLRGPEVELKGPKADARGPKGELSAPELEASPPSVEVDIQVPGGKLEGDVAVKDSKFKMPKFKMPSFGMSAPGKAMEASLEVSAPKVEADVALPATQGDLKTPEASAQLASADVDLQTGQVGVKLPEGALPEAELPATGAGTDLKGHLPRVQMPSIKMPKVDLRGPEVELKGPKADARGPKGEFSAPELEASPPSVEVDIQVPSGKLEGDVAVKDSKFKMPKFKMPSFGVSATGKSFEASLEVSAPMVEADVALPATQGDLKTPEASAQLAASDVDLQAVQVGMKLPEGALPEAELPALGAGDGLKGHLPRVQLPSMKMPKVDLRGQVELKGPKADARGPKGELSAPELEASAPSMEVDVQVPSGKLEGDVAVKDSKFKMPKFKMPSFGMSAPSKSFEASLELSAPKVEADVALPATQGDLKTPEASAQLASSDVDLKAGQVGVKLPEGALPEAELPATGAGTDLKGHLPRVQMPSIKMPKVDLRGPEVELKGPKADARGPKGELSAPELEASPPSVEVDIQVPGGKLEGDVAVKDSKFKMPKFKMPSFGMSAPGKAMEASLEVSAPKVEADVALPATQGDLKTPEASAQLASADVDLQTGQVGVKLPEGALPEAELPATGAGTDLKGHLPRVQMPSIKMPKVDLRGPEVELKGPKADARGPKGELSAPELEASPPSVEVDIQVPGGKLEGDVAVKDSKFKMPKFKMPSFGMLAPGKAMEASLEVSAPKVEADVALPATQGDLKTPEASAQLASADVDLQTGQVGVKLPEGALPEAELPATGAGTDLKGHLPRVQMPSIKMPKVDLRGPEVELKGPKADARGPKGELSAPELEASPPSVEVDIQVPGGKLEGDVAVKDSKFKMPKFKMPSFGMLAPGKAMEASLEVSAPKVEADVALPATQGDLKTPEASAQLASADVDLQTGQVGVKLPEGALPEAELPATGAGTDLKGHLPRVQMPSIKMPKVDLRGPEVELKGLKADARGPKGEFSAPELEASPPSVEVDIQVPGGKLEGNVAVKDSKFKMPKFKMPSFSVSATGKSFEASLEVSAPKVEADVALPTTQGDLKTPEASAQLASSDVDLKAGQVGVKLPEGALPEAELPTSGAGAGLKGHLPRVQMPSIKMPKVDLRGQVELKGPKADARGPKGELSAPKLEASAPSMEVDIQAPGGKLEGKVAAKDSKFKMPEFKMPSLGVSAPGKSFEASLEVSAPKVEANVALPATLRDLKTPEASAQLASSDGDLQAVQVGVKLPEGALPEAELPASGAGDGLKGHLPRVQLPSMKMPKVDLRGQVELKGPKADARGPKGELSAPELEASVPSMEVDVQVPGGKLEGDVAIKVSKFKMPKFKMPSFGVSAPGKSFEASLEVSAPRVEADVALPAIQGNLKTSEPSAQLASSDVDLQAGQVGVKLPEGALPEAELPATGAGTDLKGHLPRLQMPSIKMPKVDLRGPEVELKGPKADARGPKGEFSAPELEASPPSVEVDIQVPGGKLEGDVAVKDSKFKMPKFKMPSFGVSATGKSFEASLEVSAPMVEADVALPATQGDLKTPEASAQLAASDVDLQAVQVGMKLPEGALPEAELPASGAGDGLKGHLPRVQLPSMKMPKVDLRGQVELKGPKADARGPKGELSAPELEASAPSMEVDVQVPGGKLEGDVAVKDSKFKMPKFKMPSFGMSAPSKSFEASLELSAPKVEADVALPATQGDLKTPEASAQLASSDVDLKAGQVGVKLPEGALPEAELPTAGTGADLKGHLPREQMRSIKMPKVDLRGLQVELKGPKVDARCPKGELSAPELEASSPSVEVDLQAPGGKLEGEVATKDSKFKMPKFKMPSFGVSAPGKSMEASLEVSEPKLEADMALPANQGDLKTPKSSAQLPSSYVDLQPGQVGVKLPEGALPEAELPVAGAGAGLKGHLPRVQMPSIKMPKVDLKGPQVELKGPKADARGPKGELSAPELDASPPSVEVDVQAPGDKLEGEVAAKDSKFKMPKFKMPSFGVSAPGKSFEASLEVSAPKVEADVALPAIQGDLKTPETSAQLASADVDLQAGQVGVKLPGGALPQAEVLAVCAGASLKGHLPSVQMPSIVMPKVDQRGPQVELKGPKGDARGPKGQLSAPEVEASPPSVEVDVQSLGSKLEPEVATKDSKFKMPKFKMPSFGVSAPGKSFEASLEVSAPRVEADVALPAIQGDLKTSEASAQLASADVDLQAGQVGVKLPEGALPEAELPATGAGTDLKGHLPRVQMPSIKMPKVDLRGPEVELKGPKADARGPKGELSAPELETSPPSVEVDIQVPGGKLEGDVAVKDSKFKMPKFKMPSFGMSAPGKSFEASLELSVPKVEADVALPATQGDLKTPESSTQLAFSDVDLQAVQVGVKLPEGALPEAELPTAGTGAGLKGHLPRVQMPSIKMPKVDLRGPQVELKGPKVDARCPKGELSAPELEASSPSVEVDLQAPGGKLEGEVATKDSKFKMPKFKMPSFGVSAPGKSMEALLEVSEPKVEADMVLPTIQGDLKTPERSAQLASANVDLQAGQVGMKLPGGALPQAEVLAVCAGASLKGHLPSVQMPSIVMPKVDQRGPQVELKGPKADARGPKGELSAPKLEASAPSMEVDVQAPGGKLEGKVATKDSKFKMPEFKMPSLGVSAPGKSFKASLEVSAPKVEADVALPATQGDLKTPETSAQLASSDGDLQAVQVGVKLPEGALPEAELPASGAGDGLKGHLPRVQMPSIKMPKVDLRGQVELKGPKADARGPKGELRAPELEASAPSMEVDVQVPGGKLEGDVAVKVSKFKMPRFKMPSFGMSVPGKSFEASLEVSAPKVEADVALPATQGDLKTPEASAQLASSDGDLQAVQVGVKLPEGALPEAELPASGAGDGLKGHLPRVQLPSMKMPKVDLRGQVELKGPKADARGPKGELSAPELEASAPSMEVDVQVPGGKLEGDVAIKVSKFKMPKFKMPSFGMSVPGKSFEASLELSAPKVEANVALPATQGDLKTPEASAQLASSDVDLKAGQVGVKLPEGALPEAELPTSGAEAGLKGHLPRVQMPSIKMPKVDLRGQVELKGPKADARGPKGELSAPKLEASAPSMEVDVQVPGGKLEGEVAAKDSKFKMPEFKMPSLGVLAPGKSFEASLEVSAPKVEADVALPAIQGDLKTPETSAQLASTDVDLQAGQVGVKLPGGALPQAEVLAVCAGASLKGHLPSVQMPSIVMPKVDQRGPQVELKGPKGDARGPKGQLSAPELEALLPSVEVDVQSLGGKLEPEVATKDSKFKMPKLKMPSFGVSAPGKSFEASLEVSAPRVEADVALPAIQGNLKTSEASAQLASADVDLQAGQVGVKLPEGALPEAELPATGAGTDLKGHLPRVQMPSIKMPKVDLRGPEVEVKGPKVDSRGPKGEFSAPELEASPPSVEVDIQVPGGKLEGDVAVKESKFKMPKFKMPSFGMSAPGKSFEASLELSAPKVEADVALPATQGDLKTPEASAQLAFSDVDLQAVQVGVKLPEGALPEAELPTAGTGAGLKGHLPREQMPSIKMPKVDLRGPQVELKGPKVDARCPKGELSAPELEASSPSVEVDLQAPGGKLEGEVATKDSKFKMPKFKMPSFGVSAPGKSMEASLEVSEPKLEADMALPANQGDLKTPKSSAQLPSSYVDLQPGQVGVKLPEGALPEAELPVAGAGAGLKGHLPRVQMPSIKMPKVDLKGPQVELKGPKADARGPKGELSAPELDASPPSVEVDVQAPGDKLECEVAAKDSKFKMPKFKMPSLGVLAPGKSMEVSLEVSAPKVEAEMVLPTIQGDLKTPERSAQLASANVDLQAGQVGVKLLEGALPEVEVCDAGAGAGLKGHLPRVQMPSIKIPKVDLRGPHVELKGPKADARGPKGELSAPELEGSPPSVQVDIQAPGDKLEGEVAANDSKLKMPYLLLPRSGVSSSKGAVSSSDVVEDYKFTEILCALSSGNIDAVGSQCVCESDSYSHGSYVFGKAGKESKVKKPSFEVPVVQFSQRKVQKGILGLEEASSSCRLHSPPSPCSYLAPAESSEPAVTGSSTAVPLPKLTLLGFPSCSPGTIDLVCARPGSSVLPPTEGVTLTQFPVPVFAPGAPHDAASGALAVAPFMGSPCSAGPQAEQSPQATPTGHHSRPEGPLSPMVTFPKFYKPRFMVSVPLAVAPDGDPSTTAWGPVLPFSQAPGEESSAQAAEVSPLPVSQLALRAVPVSQTMEEPLSPSAEGATAEGAEDEWTRGPFKPPHFKVLSFSRSPKKEARPAEDTSCHLEDPSGSLAVYRDHGDSQPGGECSHVEAHMALPPGKEGDSRRTRKAGFALPRLALPKWKASKGQAGPRPQGDSDTVLSSSTAAGDCEATGMGGSEGGVGSSGLPEGSQEAGHVAHQLPQTPVPSVGLAKPDLQSSLAQEGASQCEADPRQDPEVGGDSEGSGLGDISASQPHGEGTAPTTEDPLKPSLGHADQVPTLNSPKEAPTVGGTTANSQERWFRMPRLRMPGFGRSSSKEQGGAREQDVAQVHMLMATAPAEAAAAGSVLESSILGPEVEASVSLQPLNTEAMATVSGSTSYADVLKRDLHCSGLKPHTPAVGKTGGDQPPSTVQTRPAEGSLPLQKPSRWPSEPQAPAAERCDLTKAEEKTELRPSLPEGPVTLRASNTDAPSQVSVVSVQQLWEDSVLSVTFPKLGVPRLSFPAPGSEADVFLPVVRDAREAGAGVDPGPGLWDASLLRAGPGEPREQPVGSDCPWEASPVSKVKVHIQGVQGECCEVVVCSQVTRESVELLVPEDFSTQIVRESEIPTSTVQTPSYGFSLLKLKTLGPPAQAPDPRAQEGSAATSADSLPEDDAPDATEPFEVISASASLPGLRTLESDIPARPPPADSGFDNDEELAEILEFLPEESSEAAAPLVAEDRVPKGRQEGKKPSGVFWSWLPSIGFSSSVNETTAHSSKDAQRSVPVQTQPGPRPDLEPPKRQERVGWFRFPKLGFSSSPTKKMKSMEDEAGLAEQMLQEESVTFFDARESFSPEEKVGEPAVSALGTTGMVASSARTELILLEPDTGAGEESAPRSMSK
ncbi:protein AHNAK2 [Erethizon dorsatum]